MRTAEGHVRHANYVRCTVLNEPHAGEPGVITGKLRADDVHEPTVDFVYDFELARQQIAEWEAEDGLRPSLPQIAGGEALLDID